MIGNVGLPGWFVATRLRVMLKQPNSRGTPGSFVTIFSAVNRLDVCPVGYYNRRMKFLRRTGDPSRKARILRAHSVTACHNCTCVVRTPGMTLRHARCSIGCWRVSKREEVTFGSHEDLSSDECRRGHDRFAKVVAR